MKHEEPPRLVGAFKTYGDALAAKEKLPDAYGPLVITNGFATVEEQVGTARWHFDDATKKPDAEPPKPQVQWAVHFTEGGGGCIGPFATKEEAMEAMRIARVQYPEPALMVNQLDGGNPQYYTRDKRGAINGPVTLKSAVICVRAGAEPVRVTPALKFE